MTSDATRWTALSPAGISGYRHTRALVHDPGLPGVVLFTQGAGVHQRDLWRWSGDRFTHLAGGIFPEHQYGNGLHAIFACHDPVVADTLLFGLTGSRAEPETRAALTGVVLTSLRHPDRDRTLAYPPQLADDRRVFAAFRIGERLLLLAHDGTVLGVPQDGDTLDLVAGPIPDLDEEKYELRTAAADPDRGIIVASSDDYDGRMFVWSQDAGWVEGPATGEEGNSVVWNPVDRRVDVLCGKAPQTVRPFDQPDADGPRLPFFTRAAPIARDGTDGSWLLLDRDNDAYVARDSTVDGPGFVAAPVPPWKLPFDATDDRWCLTATSDGPLWAARLDDRALARLDGDRWSSMSHDVDDVELAAATPRGLVVLDDEGAVHRVDSAGRAVRLSRPEEDVAGRSYEYNNDRLCWDEAGDRLVLWCGEDLETWVQQRGRWHELETDDTPPEGEALLCANPGGLYCFVADELWLLRGDEWSQVGEDADWQPQALFWSVRRGGLWSVSADGIAVWRDGRFQPVAELPPGCALSKREPGKIVLFDTGCRVGYDPVSDQLFAHGGGGGWRLSLADLVPSEVPELPGLGTDEQSLPPRPADTAREPSYYIVECSGSSAWRDLAMAYSYPDLDQVRTVVEANGCAARGAAFDDLGLALELVTTTFTWRLWTVQHGVLSDGLDLLPHFEVHFADGSSLRAAPGNHEAIWDREGDAVAVTVDWGSVVAAVPELREPRIRPGDVSELRIDGHPAPEAASFLVDGTVLRYGEMDDRDAVDEDDPED
ncbi:hypothetical protein GCM10022225_59480 [Plantactinospora mayteni]|uniref:Uncharacterized protein n=1 Tax=Plantactinospora mayteni TaxID=566021 RepID=A0ABQ4EKG0_9ACTN|nr:hypothetical protein [Plantactinospora mayteni]GIG95201.1 hypothetical protein Pma05_17740 [Plantactinospora mayteni]